MRNPLPASAISCFSILILVLVTGCSASRKTKNQSELVKAIVAGKLSEPYAAIYNTVRTHGLFVEQRSGDHIARTINFIVIRLSDQQVLHEGNYKMGDVRWIDDASIEVKTFSSVTDEVGTKKIINITTLR